MKANNIFKTLFLLICGFVSFSLYSCEKNDDFIEKDKKVAPTYQVIPLTYFDFISPNDVTSNSENTSIRVNRQYLNKMNYSIAPGDIAAVMTSIEEMPFYLRVTRVDEVDENWIEVSGTKATVEEAIGNFDAVLNTNPYFNDAPSSRSVSLGNSLNADPRLISDDGEIHPTIIRRTSRDIPKEDLLQMNYTKVSPSANFRSVDDGEEYLAFDVRQQGRNLTGEAKLGFKFIRDFDLKLSEDSVLNYKGALSAEVGARVAVKTSWFSLKKFEATFYGGYDLKSMLSMKFEKSITFGDKDYKPVTKISSYYATFFITFIPVTIEICPEVVRKMNAKVSGSLKLGIPLNFQRSFEHGVRYENSRWTEICEDKSSSSGFDLTKTQIQAEVSLSAEAGIYIQVGAYLYGTTGPYVLVGPSVQAKVDAKATVDHKGVELSASADLALVVSGAVGAKVKIWKWDLFDCKLPFELARVTLLHESWSVSSFENGSPVINENLENTPKILPPMLN
ncbi:MAG: hypothetical protein ACRCZY_12435 [Phocaeicola sp.]